MVASNSEKSLGHKNYGLICQIFGRPGVSVIQSIQSTTSGGTITDLQWTFRPVNCAVFLNILHRSDILSRAAIIGWWKPRSSFTPWKTHSFRVVSEGNMKNFGKVCFRPLIMNAQSQQFHLFGPTPPSRGFASILQWCNKQIVPNLLHIFSLQRMFSACESNYVFLVVTVSVTIFAIFLFYGSQCQLHSLQIYLDLHEPAHDRFRRRRDRETSDDWSDKNSPVWYWRLSFQ